MPTWFYLLVALVPGLAIVARPSVTGVLVGTVLPTWAAVTFVLGAVDGEYIVAFALIVMPWLVVGISMVLATWLAPAPRRWFEAGFFSLAGCWFGLSLLMFAPISSGASFWDDALFAALPTVYGASGAAFGATFKV